VAKGHVVENAAKGCEGAFMFQDRINSAIAIIKEHNDAIAPGETGKPGQVNPEKFIECIKASGGTSEDRLRRFSYEDILSCMPATDGIKPVIIAKEIAQAFRGKDESGDADKRPIQPRRVATMTPRELVENLDPEDSSSPVSKRLQEISRNEKFIVFASGRQVDVETTLKLLLEVKAGHSGRNDIDASGKVKKVYRIGELPDNLADENPLYSGRALRPDGTCDQTSRSWEGIPLNVRQLIYLAVQVGDLKVNIDSAHATIDAALEADAFNKISRKYRKAAVRFDELSQSGSLPNLKVPIKSNGNKPFENGTKVVWR
jgi:hypothetical protein